MRAIVAVSLLLLLAATPAAAERAHEQATLQAEGFFDSALSFVRNAATAATK
jgi:hypothetical protein